MHGCSAAFTRALEPARTVQKRAAPSVRHCFLHLVLGIMLDITELWFGPVTQLTQ